MKQVYNRKQPKTTPYRALFISDIHMSNKLPGAVVVERGITDRLNDQINLWRRVYSAAKKSKSDAIYILGDLFDQSKVDAITLTATIQVIVESPVPVFILAGNHDAVNPTRGERFTVEALGRMGSGYIHYISTAEPVKLNKWLTFWPIEFCSVPKTKEHILAISEEMKRNHVNVLLMHNSIIGCSHIGWKCDHGLEAEDVTNPFDHVISGHFHDPQEFGENGRYLGAPMHHHYGDVNREAGFWVMQFNEDGTRAEVFVDGGAPRFHVFEWDEIHDDGIIMTGGAHKGSISIESGDYVRIRVEATSAELVKAKPLVEDFVAQMNGEGIHASWIFKPVYHHITRMKSLSNDIGPLTLDSAIEEYIEAVDVNTSGLDRDQLKQVGSDIYKSAAGQWQE